ncbi:pentapeptide repeat-containing protein [Cereibacter johrii]|uniref:pentapeptide repeat-containing protein n=1 Tax=Cereibacter johrii TaxID=445629 RepID=UPI001428A3CB|nr:pentapeptide repeat-containing protein [Cereibacter johrii]
MERDASGACHAKDLLGVVFNAARGGTRLADCDLSPRREQMAAMCRKRPWHMGRQGLCDLMHPVRCGLSIGAPRRSGWNKRFSYLIPSQNFVFTIRLTLNVVGRVKFMADSEDLELLRSGALDLSRCDFREADLRGMDLRGRNFSYCLLEKAKCEGANFEGSDFRGAQVNFMIANNATFDSCNLSHLHFGYTDLSSASLKGATANGAVFQNVKLKGANLEGASLAGGSINADTDLEDVRSDERSNFDGLKVLRATSRNTLFQDYDFNNGILQRRTAAIATMSADKPTVDKPLEELVNTGQRQVRVAKVQIQQLIQNSAVTRLTAQQFAGQIEEALRGIPANQGNRLIEPLQTMLEFAEVLRNIAPDTAPPATRLDSEDLKARIIELETLVERLTEQLSDATKAQKVAEELVQSDGFIANFRRSAGKAAGIASVTALASVVTVGVPAAAVYFLGAEHPLVATFINSIGRMPK